MTMHPPRRWTLLATSLSASCLTLSACAVGPDYHRPPPASPPPAQYKEVAGWSQALPSDDAPKGEWWKDFHDPLMDELLPQVRIDNQTVRQSYANYLQAVALVHGANAALYPTLAASASATRTGLLRGGGSSSSAGSDNQYQVEGQVSWSPDLWGKVRRQIQENAASAQASEANFANAILSEQVTLATAIVNLRIADANIALLTRTVATYQEDVRVVSTAVAAGYSLYPPSSEAQARTQLETAQANLLNAGIARAQYVHAIAVLVGRNPGDLTIPPGETLPALPDIPVGLPSTLLQRRPDIAAAERTMAANSAAIGVAVAAYYPNISLSGGVGSAASALSGLFSAATSAWQAARSASETLIDFGARKAQVDQARAAYDASVASYRGTVLSALQGVEDTLVSLRVLERQAIVLDAAVRDATRATEIAHSEFQVGTVDYTTVTTAETTELTTRQSALAVRQTRLNNAISLIGDLGGGWSAAQLHDPRHVSARAPMPAAPEGQ